MKCLAWAGIMYKDKISKTIPYINIKDNLGYCFCEMFILYLYFEKEEYSP